MARPSKLSPAQWAEVERRMAEGEGVRELAREFGVSPSIISRRVSQQSQQVRTVAQQVAAARDQQERALATLPPAQQYRALNLADKLRNISASLASAAELGAATAHRLQALANTEVAKVDDAEPLKSLESLRSVGVLAKLANDSSAIALNLLAANKEAVQKVNNPETPEELAPVRERLSLADWKKAHGLN